MTQPLKINKISDQEVEIVRLFNAPCGLVFDCWTKPALIRRWMTGPDGWTFAVCEVDLRVGGQYRYVWRSPDGGEMGMTGIYREITPPVRLVDAQIFDEDWTGGETIGTVIFAEQGQQTLVTTTVRYASIQARDAALATGMAEGMEMGYQHLDQILAER